MSTHRAVAIKALRDWAATATPARRAALIAAAWRAGEVRVAALAEAAGVTRQTAYTDLRTEGIDPDDRGATMTTLAAPLDIDGITGDPASAEAELDAALTRWAEAHPDATRQEATAAGVRLFQVVETTSRYATARAALAREAEARVDRDRALHRVETAWAALSTTNGRWLAAHHAYTVAVDAAHAAVDAWAQAAAEAAGAWDGPGEGPRTAVYGQILAAGHPALEEAVAALDPAPAQTAAELRADLGARHQRRAALAAQTAQLARTAAHTGE